MVIVNKIVDVKLKYNFVLIFIIFYFFVIL